MQKRRKGVIFIPILVAILLFGAGMFSSHLDEQVVNYDQEFEETKTLEEKVSWEKITFGPYISFTETQLDG